MSAYTLITTEDCQAFLNHYDVKSPLAALKAIHGGIQNSNYFVTLVNQEEYVLTIYENIPFEDLLFLAPLLHHLEKQDCLVAAPLMQKNNGSYIGILSNKPAQLLTKLTGQHLLHPNHEQLYALGQALAKLHMALNDSESVTLLKNRNFSAQWTTHSLIRFWQQPQPRFPVEKINLIEKFLTRWKLNAEKINTLPQQFIHADLFRDNVLFENNHVSGLLDFSELDYDFRIWDIAITLNDFCYYSDNNKSNEPLYITKNIQNFIEGYQSIALITIAELQLLTLFRAHAALRFFTSRWHVQQRNHAQQLRGDSIQEKNPEDMWTLFKSLTLSLE